MSVSSLRPERSASANSATPAGKCELYFISNACFVKCEVLLHQNIWEQIFLQVRLSCIPYKIVLLAHYSTDRGCIFLLRKSLYYLS